MPRVKTPEEMSEETFESLMGGTRPRWRGAAPRIRFIDDMVYWGLEYEGAEKPFSFAQVDERSQRNSFVLFGPSKAGLANVRAGLIYADSNDIYKLQMAMHDSNYFPPSYVMEAMSGYFSDEQPFKVIRDLHMTNMNAEHQFLGQFMKVLINGSKERPTTSIDDYNRMNRLLVEHTGMSQKQAHERLTQGVEGVEVVTSPQAGFFHMLDFSGLTGRYYEEDRAYGTSRTEIKDENQISRAMKKLNVSMAAGAWTGLEEEQMLKRVSFAMPPEDIIDFTDRLTEMVTQTYDPQSRIVPDMKHRRTLML